MHVGGDRCTQGMMRPEFFLHGNIQYSRPHTSTHTAKEFEASKRAFYVAKQKGILCVLLILFHVQSVQYLTYYLICFRNHAMGWDGWDEIRMPKTGRDKTGWEIGKGMGNGKEREGFGFGCMYGMRMNGIFLLFFIETGHSRAEQRGKGNIYHHIHIHISRIVVSVCCI